MEGRRFNGSTDSLTCPPIISVIGTKSSHSYHLYDGDVRLDRIDESLHRRSTAAQKIIRVHDDVNRRVDDEGKCRHASWKVSDAEPRDHHR